MFRTRLILSRIKLFLLRLSLVVPPLLGLALFQNCGVTWKPLTFESAAGASYCVSGSDDSACAAVAAAGCTFNGAVLSEHESVTAFLNSTPGALGCQSEVRRCADGVLSGSFAYATCAATVARSCLFDGRTIASGSSVTGYLNATGNVGSPCQSQTRTCADGALTGAYPFASCDANSNASCLFNGQTIAHGSSVTAYDAPRAASGQSCLPHLRTCFNGAFTGSGEYAACSVVASAVPCTFNGQTIADGQSLVAYATSTVPNGQSCVAIPRTCRAGSLTGLGEFASCQVDQPAACLLDGQTVPDGGVFRRYGSSVAALGTSCTLETRACANGVLSGSATVTSCIDCNGLAASRDPFLNSASLSSCLSRGGAVLGPGIFPVAEAVVLPPGAKLSGTSLASSLAPAPAPAQATTWGAALAQPYPSNTVLWTQGQNSVSQLRVTAVGQVRDDCCSSVVEITGSGSQLDHVEIFDLDPATGAPPPLRRSLRTVGIYYIGDSESGRNVVSNATVHDLFMGAIFRDKLPKGDAANSLVDTEILRTACDGVTIGGYGILNRNHIHDTGYNCLQEPLPIPGAGVYTLKNLDGALIVNNVIERQCGHGLDLNESANFVIQDNVIRESGVPFDGTYAYCNGQSAASLTDLSHSTVRGNTFSVSEAPPLGPFLTNFPAFANDPAVAKALYPLPQRDLQVIALRVLTLAGLSTGNTFDNNQATAACTNGTCVGIGIYVGPGSGLDQSGVWSPSSTNYFTRNRVNGSNIGSLRCGNDWYAANDTCVSLDSGGQCNDDDFQHAPGSISNWSRNDHCPSP